MMNCVWSIILSTKHLIESSKYNSKHGPTPILATVYCEPNHPITQHHHPHSLHHVRPNIKCSDMISTDQKIHLSDFLSSFYANYYPWREHPQGPTPSSPCVTHENDDSIDIVLTPESITPKITVFSKCIYHSGSCLLIFIRQTYYSTLPWLWPGCISGWYYYDAIKLVGILR